MRPLIVYFSRTSNTVAVAETIADELRADLYRVEEFEPSLLAGRRVIGLGSGIYNTRPAKQILKLIPRIPRGTKVFVFFTSGFVNPWLVKLYMSRFRKPIAKQGLELLGIWNAQGHDKYLLLKWADIGLGRPDADDLASARAFAAAMKPVQETD